MPTYTFLNSLEMPFLQVEEGTFRQGATSYDNLARDNEKPAHLQHVKTFFMSIHPVTQAEYMKVMHINPSYFSKLGDGWRFVQQIETDNFPVESVSWDDAMEFCRRLSNMTIEREKGFAYRLPTEAEWEFACKAGNDTVFANGDSFTSNDANINGNYPYNSQIVGKTINRPCPVGLYTPNQLGFFDMHGNVWEWCLDTFKPYNVEHVPNQDARVLRGGSWNCYSRFCRASYRCINNRNSLFYDCGFRIVCENR